MRPLQTVLIGLKHDKKQQFFYQIMTPLPPPQTHAHRHWPKSLGYLDFKMVANEKALTQPKFELGFCGIIQNVFQGD